MNQDMKSSRTAGVKTVCFTGHRSIPSAHAECLPRVLERELRRLISEGAEVFRAGGAMGFDTVAALKVLELQEEFPHIQLELILPCRDQTARWGAHDIRAYEYVLSRATRYTYLYDRYVDGCMLARNRKLVEGSDVCVAYCTRSRGGSAYTCAYALRQGLELINLSDALQAYGAGDHAR